jgi:hypothetical protein
LTETTIAMVKAANVRNDRTRIMRRACAAPRSRGSTTLGGPVKSNPNRELATMFQDEWESRLEPASDKKRTRSKDWNQE